MITNRQYAPFIVACLSAMIFYSVQVVSVDNKVRSKSYPHKSKPLIRKKLTPLHNRMRNRTRRSPQRIQIQRVIPNNIILTSGITGSNVRIYGKHLNLYKSIAVYSHGVRKRHEFAIRVIQARPNQILLNIRLKKPLLAKTQYRLKLYSQNKYINTPLVIRLRHKPGRNKNQRNTQLRLKQRTKSTLKPSKPTRYTRTKKHTRTKKLSRKPPQNISHRIIRTRPENKIVRKPKKDSRINSREKSNKKHRKIPNPAIRTPGFQTASSPIALNLSIRSVGFNVPLKPRVVKLSINSKGFHVTLKPRVVKLSINSQGFNVIHQPRTVNITIQSKGFHVKIKPPTNMLPIRSKGLHSK